MAAYAQFGYNYPSANQLISGATSAAAMDSQSAHGGGSGSVPSPLSGTNEASLSPSGGSTTTGVTTGPLSPGAISQSSNNAGTSAVALAATSPAHAVGRDASGATTADTSDNTPESRDIEGMSCCENGRPIMTDPVSGQNVCSCQYDTARLTLGGYSRMPTAGVGMYGGPYPSNEQNPYPSIGVDSSAFYSPLGNPYGMKDNSACSDMSAWTSTGLQPTTGYYSYDPTLAAYGYGPSYDLAARRKNATRESTATLKAWLSEHKKNPYPTKGEKIMLAIITKMTLTQVSTWFANARRRLKKENKMTWEPKNKTEDDDDGLMSDDEKEKESNDGPKLSADTFDHSNQLIKSEHAKSHKEQGGSIEQEPDREPQSLVAMRGLSAYDASYSPHTAYHPYAQPQAPLQQQAAIAYYQHGYGQEGSDYAVQKNPQSRDCGIPVPASKPKIWSVADTVACKTPPPTAYLGQNSYAPNPAANAAAAAAAAAAAQLQLQPPVQVQLQQPQLQQQQQQQPLQQLQQQQSLTTQSLAMQMNRVPPQVELSSPLSMMSTYVAASPYSRTPTVYTEPIRPGPAITRTPTSMHPNQLQGQPHAMQPAYPPPQRMGFSEIQPDTPPQTPPNVKLGQHNNSSSSSNSSNSNSNSNSNNSSSNNTSSTSGSVLALTSMGNMCYSNGRSNAAAYAHANGFMPGGDAGA